MKSPKNTMHPMVETSERFFIMWLLQRNVESNRVVLYEKGILKIFTKFARKYLCWSLFLIRLQRLQHRCFPANFKNTYFVEHLGAVTSKTPHN